MDEQHAHDAAEHAAQGQAAQVAAPEEDRVAEKRADRRRRRRAMIAGGAGLALLIGVTAGGLTYGATTTTASASTTDQQVVEYPSGAFGGARVSPYSGGSSGAYSGLPDGYGSGAGTSSGTATTTTTDAVAATAAQTAGVVTIVSTLGYESAQSAGTGVVLTSDGMILTNNHVIEGSTSIEVTVESTGETYTATVVGTDATDDIAVLQLVDASGLTAATLDTDGTAVGDTVTAIGNAEGTGDLVAATGTVTALEQTITTRSESGAEGETLEGLIQVDADIVSGDSGGPLVNESGEVVGIDTAASSGSSDITGFAIPISTALDIVAQIEAGNDTETIEIGYSGFLGVGLAQSSVTGAPTGSSSTGAVIAGVYEDTPAAEAGLVAGDVVTSVDGTAVASADELSAALADSEPGETVTLTWTDAAGASQSASITLIAGPVA